MAEVEPGTDICPGVPSPSTLTTESSGEVVPICMSHSSVEELAVWRSIHT